MISHFINERRLNAFGIVEEPRDDVYRSLLAWCASRCTTGLVLVRDTNTITENATRIIDSVAPEITSVEQTQQWPGTTLLGANDYATLYRFRLTPLTIDLTITAVDGLYEWAGPNKPEDLCLLRSDGAALLVTIAHERDAYLSLTTSEAAEIGHVVPHLKIASHPRL